MHLQASSDVLHMVYSCCGAGLPEIKFPYSGRPEWTVAERTSKKICTMASTIAKWAQLYTASTSMQQIAKTEWSYRFAGDLYY